MNDWLPLAIGLAIIVVGIALVVTRPTSSVALELRRVYGVRPSGAYNLMNRHDLLRRAGYSFVAAGTLFASSFALFPLTDRLANESTPRLVLEGYFFMAFLLGGVAALAAILSLLSIAVWRPRTIETTPDRLADFADYLTRLSRGDISYEGWRDLSVVRFDHTSVEAVRLAFVARIGARPRALSDDDIVWLRDCADTLLAHAV